MTRLLCIVLIALAIIPVIPAQTPGPGVANDIFAGTISELNADRITVVQRVPAKEAITRTFSLDAQTVVEGKPVVGARVTVRFRADESGVVRALRIIVR